jgi:hypothetical protein
LVYHPSYFVISEQIDDELLDFIQSSIEKCSSHEEADDMPQAKTDGKSQSITADVLRMVQRRLKAELFNENRDETKLLARLMREVDAAVSPGNFAKYIMRFSSSLTFCLVVCACFCLVPICLIYCLATAIAFLGTIFYPAKLAEFCRAPACVPRLR